MIMSVNSVETKALEKLFKSLYPDIMGFNYDIEFKDYDEPKKIWTDRYRVGEINVDVSGESNVEVFTAGLIKAYVEEMVDSILKYVGVPKNHLYDVKIIDKNIKSFFMMVFVLLFYNPNIVISFIMAK